VKIAVVGLQNRAHFRQRSCSERAETRTERTVHHRGQVRPLQVTTTVTPLERNRVDDSISNLEGELAKDPPINHRRRAKMIFSDKDLRSAEFVLRTPGWLTCVQKERPVFQAKAAGDLETCVRFT